MPKYNQSARIANPCTKDVENREHGPKVEENCTNKLIYRYTMIARRF